MIWGMSVCLRGKCMFVLFVQGTLEGELVHCSGSLFQGKSPLMSANNSQHLCNGYYVADTVLKVVLLSPFYI